MMWFIVFFFLLSVISWVFSMPNGKKDEGNETFRKVMKITNKVSLIIFAILLCARVIILLFFYGGIYLPAGNVVVLVAMLVLLAWLRSRYKKLHGA